MRPLRLAVMLEQALEVGGGFQQPLNDMLWLRDWAAESGNEIAVYSPYPRTLEILTEFDVTARLPSSPYSTTPTCFSIIAGSLTSSRLIWS